MARIMITWGLAAAATALVVGPYSFYVVRLILGIAEAGFFPGVIFFLTLWFPAQYRTRVLAWFTVATPISFLVGGPLSIWLLQMHGFLGLAGWQRMFIIEGVPACILGLIMLKVLTNHPAKDKWLTPNERQLIAGMLAEEENKGHHSHGFKAALKDPRVWILSSITFSFTLGSYGIGIWLPQMLKAHGVEVSMIGWVAAIPYFFATIGLLVWAKHVDRTGKGYFQPDTCDAPRWIGTTVCVADGCIGSSFSRYHSGIGRHDCRKDNLLHPSGQVPSWPGRCRRDCFDQLYWWCLWWFCWPVSNGVSQGLHRLLYSWPDGDGMHHVCGSWYGRVVATVSARAVTYWPHCYSEGILRSLKLSCGRSRRRQLLGRLQDST